MEALYALATGESFRAEKVDEMITFDQELGRVKGKIIQQEIDDEEHTFEQLQAALLQGGAEDEDQESGVGREVVIANPQAETQSQANLPDGEEVLVEVMLTQGSVQGKKTAKRLYTVNGVRRRKQDATSHLSAVVFRPEDMRLVEGSPARRRAFLDLPLSACFPEYAASLKTYEQTLRRRNKLLQQVRDGEQSKNALHYWNMSLVSHGERIQKHRRNLIHSFGTTVFPISFSVVYAPSVISAERVDEYVAREVAAGHTLIGPHKDDFAVLLAMEGEERDISLFGSRGQQRLAVLWLKFGELAYLRAKTRQQPLLLLDDILSELDDNSRHLALQVVRGCQSIITTTEEEVVGLLKENLPQGSVTVLKLERTDESRTS